MSPPLTKDSAAKAKDSVRQSHALSAPKSRDVCDLQVRLTLQSRKSRDLVQWREDNAILIAI